MQSSFGPRYRYPVVVIADGEIVIDRDTTIRRIENARFTVLFVLLPLSLVIFAVGSALLINLQLQRYAAASSK